MSEGEKNFQTNCPSGENGWKKLSEGGKIDKKMSEGGKIDKKCRREKLSEGGKIGQNRLGGVTRKKNMSEGGKKSCFVSEGVRKIPVFSQGVEKIPILSEGVTEIFLPPPLWHKDINSRSLTDYNLAWKLLVCVMRLLPFVTVRKPRTFFIALTDSIVPTHNNITEGQLAGQHSFRIFSRWEIHPHSHHCHQIHCDVLFKTHVYSPHWNQLWQDWDSSLEVEKILFLVLCPQHF